MADTDKAPETRTLLLRRIAQLEQDLAETRGCIIRLAGVIENLLIEGHPGSGADDSGPPDAEDWVAPIIPLEPGRPGRDGAAAGRRDAGRRPLRRAPRARSRPQRASSRFIL
jgi:hypothetical protein